MLSSNFQILIYCGTVTLIRRVKVSGLVVQFAIAPRAPQATVSMVGTVGIPRSVVMFRVTLPVGVIITFIRPSCPTVTGEIVIVWAPPGLTVVSEGDKPVALPSKRRIETAVWKSPETLVIVKEL